MQGLILLVDMVYLGFVDGLEQDMMGLWLFVDVFDMVLVVVSCLKSMGLYCECIGVVMVIGKSRVVLQFVGGVLECIICSNYLMLLDYGVVIVVVVLGDVVLMVFWCNELEYMCQWIVGNWCCFDGVLVSLGVFVVLQNLLWYKGMFFMLLLDVDVMECLCVDYVIYGIQGGWINIVGFVLEQIDWVVGVFVVVVLDMVCVLV